MALCSMLVTACAGQSAPPAHAPAAPLLELTVRAQPPDAVTLELANTGARPVPFGGASARIEVRRDGEPLHECAAHSYRELSDEDAVLAPGEVRRFELELPCALDAPGEYALLVDLALGEGDTFAPSPVADHLAASTHLRVPVARATPAPAPWRP